MLVTPSDLIVTAEIAEIMPTPIQPASLTVAIKKHSITVEGMPAPVIPAAGRRPNVWSRLAIHRWLKLPVDGLQAVTAADLMTADELSDWLGYSSSVGLRNELHWAREGRVSTRLSVFVAAGIEQVASGVWCRQTVTTTVTRQWLDSRVAQFAN
jgi:hypothetical protein